MPVTRAIPSRRSRRLSKQEPRNYEDADQWELELENINLLYPSPSPILVPSPTTASSSFTSPLSDSAYPPFVPQPSHARKRPQGHIPRPPNAFILFRSEFWKTQKITSVERDHRNISIMAGQCWKQLSEPQRERYRLRAEYEKKLHAIRYPDYKYKPVARRSEKPFQYKKAKRIGEPQASMRVDPDRSLRFPVKKQDEASVAIVPPSVPIISTLAPAISSSRRDHKRNAALRDQFAPVKVPELTYHIKVERSPTPEFFPDHCFNSTDQEFIPTSKIPPLDLNDVKVDRNLRPPSFEHGVDSNFDTRQEPFYFSDMTMLSDFSKTDDVEYSSAGFSEYESKVEGLADRSVRFGNPFSTEPESVFYPSDLGLAAYLPGFDLPVSPKTLSDPACPALDLSDQIFAEYFNFDTF